MTHSLAWKFDKPIFEVISDIYPILEKANIRYFLVGAIARDIMDKISEISNYRSTSDIDMAIHIDNWGAFQSISDMIIQEGKFRQNKIPIHRFLHIPTGIPLDIIPYGSIESVDGEIRWPDSTSMSTLGFSESYESSIPIEISSDPDITIKIASRLGLAIMKFISWDDNRARRKKDAGDLLHIIPHYLDDANIRRLYDEHADILESKDFDFECAGARLLGRDIAKIASSQTHEKIITIIAREIAEDGANQLISEMIESRLGSEFHFDNILRILREIKTGLSESSERPFHTL